MSKSPRPAHRPRSLAAEKAILGATLRILSERGYAGLTLDRVAAAARASKATIYRRWKTKEHLILAVFAQLPMATPEAGPTLEAELVAMFGQFSQNMRASPLKGVLPRLAAECGDNPELAAALAIVNDRRREPVRTLIQRAIRRGELARATDVELAIDLIQGAIAIRMYFLLDPLSEAWMRRLARTVVKGFGRR